MNPARSARRGTTFPLPVLCSWIRTNECREPVEIVFESGLGYCREHAQAVQANREWLQQFVSRIEERRARISRLQNRD